MNELQRLKQLQHEIANPTIQAVPQIDALEQMQLRMRGDMQLQGLAERTQESYVRAIRKLAEHYGKEPDQKAKQIVGLAKPEREKIPVSSAHPRTLAVLIVKDRCKTSESSAESNNFLKQDHHDYCSQFFV